MNNALKPKLTGWRYWLWWFSASGEGSAYRKNPDVLAECPQCGGPNVIVNKEKNVGFLQASIRSPGWHYKCYDRYSYRNARMRIPGQDTQPGDVT